MGSVDLSSTPLSWIMVWTYLLVGIITAGKSHQYYRQKVQEGNNQPYMFWYALTLYLIFLAYSRHFHLHDSIYTYFRELMLTRGWYEMRRPFQSALLVGVFMSIGGFMTYWNYRYGHRGENLMFKYLGVGILSLLWILKTISLHYTDAIIHIDLGLISVSSVIELIGLSFIVFAVLKPTHAI